MDIHPNHFPDLEVTCFWSVWGGNMQHLMAKLYQQTQQRFAIYLLYIQQCDKHDKRNVRKGPCLWKFHNLIGEMRRTHEIINK